MLPALSLTSDIIASIYTPSKPDDHKASRGHALLIGGSYGKMGSILLSSKAALRCGCGLVTTFVPECGVLPLQTAFPEGMVISDQEHKYISAIRCDFKPNAIGIGPGMGQEPQTRAAFSEFVSSANLPLVIDADGLNIVSSENLLQKLPPQTILTPHIKEFERLTGKSAAPEDLRQKAADLAAKYRLVIVLKGAPTVITDGEHLYENTTGNAALATAGSGDVLTGIITSLLAQGYAPFDAARLGVYLHGLTATLAVPHTGTESFIASDIIAMLGKAFLKIREYSSRPIGFR